MLKNRKILYIVTILVCFYSCELIGDLDEVDSGFIITENNAIKDAATAEVVTKGVYSTLRNSGNELIIGVGAYVGIVGRPPSYANESYQTLYVNDPYIDNSLVKNVYAGLYRTIQNANLAIEGIEKLTDNQMSSDEQSSYIAELRFLRATCHFYLLQFYGQHYDISSEYGIVLRTEVARTATAIARNTVQECYDHIISDLNYASENAPTHQKSYRANQEAAKALKAKVLLLKGEYASAASLAKELMTNTSRSFDDSYEGMFQNINTSSEIFFAPFVNKAEDPYGFAGRYAARTAGSVYSVLAANDTLVDGSQSARAQTTKGSSQFSSFRYILIHMRLSELYLIHAEAAAREGSGVDAEALASLNAIRTRTALGLAPAAPTTKSELLEAIRIEKALELFNEGGQSFIDLVRYHKLGDITASTVKPTLTDEDKFILPIPWDDLRKSDGIVKQNPGYPDTI